MGYKETAKQITPPTEERKEIVRGEIRNTFGLLLTNGGAMTHTGVVLSFRFGLRERSVLTDDQYATLAQSRTLKLNANDTRPLLPEGRSIRQIASHVILPYTNTRLGYRTSNSEAIRLFIRGIDSNGNPKDYSISSDWLLAYAFARHTERVLKHEGFYDQVSSIQKYSDGILRDIADKDGVGNIANPITRKLPVA